MMVVIRKFKPNEAACAEALVVLLRRLLENANATHGKGAERRGS